MALTAIILRRLVALIGVLFIVTLVTFAISNLIPGDPAQLVSGPRATSEQIEVVRKSLGLDRPLHIQYAIYVSNLIGGDLGTSIASGRAVAGELLLRLPATLELMLLALAMSAAIGLLLGTAAAVREGKWLDHSLRLISLIGLSMPMFWIALVFILVFYANLGWLPPGGRLDPALTSPPHFTGFYLIDSAIEGDTATFSDTLRHLVLPVATLAMVSTGIYMRLVRNSMREILGQDYIRTARASGLGSTRVIFRHALPNALIPFVTILGIDLGHLLFGSVIVETIFSWPGLGSYVLDAIFELDFPVIMAFTVLTSVAYVLANLLVDLAYAWLDPRVRAIG